ncbi:YbjN domain-containing protein [Bacillus cytotoxicus]|uniref:YbjN domain-containing protein n=1 Tax=Bacillus cytotoxicus TaxID=580165 RepID=A0ACC6A557_9BACI|nr:YbjN domain-containing protein [Bacillus cytotoxicus]
MKNLEQFKMYLEQQEIYMEEFNPENGVPFLRAEQSIENGGNITLIIAFYEVFVEAFATDFIKVDNPLKKERVLELVNEMNTNFRFVKFVFEDNMVYLQATNFNGSTFVPEDAFECLVALLRAAEEAYPKFMRIIWG